MSICTKELQQCVIRPTLEYLGEYSEKALQLLTATAAQASHMGEHLQHKRKRGLGLYQITPRCHRMIWDKYLAKDPDLASKVRGLASQHEFLSHPDAELTTNLSYATAIAWMIYRKSGQTLPEFQDYQALSEFWVHYWQGSGNSTDRREQKHQFLSCCHQLTTPQKPARHAA